MSAFAYEQDIEMDLTSFQDFLFKITILTASAVITNLNCGRGGSFKCLHLVLNTNILWHTFNFWSTFVQLFVFGRVGTSHETILCTKMDLWEIQTIYFSFARI